MASYTSTQSGDFNAAATWGGGGWPNGGGDTYTITAGHTVTVNGDFSGTDLGASTINGLLSFATNANVALQHNAVVTINSGGELRMGNAANPIAAGYTAQLIFNPAADNTKMLDVKSGGKITTNGSAAYNTQSESWASCYTTLQAQANSGQAVIVVPAAFANALRAGGDQLLLQGTTGCDQAEIVTVLSKSGGAITLTANLTYTHATGAIAALLSRNVIMRSADVSKRGYISDANTSATTANVNLKLTELRYLYQIEAAARMTTSYCAFNQSYYVHYSSATGTRHEKLVAAGCGYSAFRNIKGMGMEYGIIGKVVQYYAIRGSGGNTFSDVRIFGCPGAALAYGAGKTFKNVTVSNTLSIFAYLEGNASLTNCSFNAINYIISNCAQGASLNARKCVFSWGTAFASASADGKQRLLVHSQDHNQVPGAAKTWHINVGTIERQNIVARSGYAAELTPDVECSSDRPLEIEWDIPCTHGDTVSVSLYVKCNAAYGAADGDKPLLVLDPDSLYGCSATSAQKANDGSQAWVKLTASGTANMGGAGNKGCVNVVLRVPHYASGAKVYADDFEVDIS